jgi:hypothetical protein
MEDCATFKVIGKVERLYGEMLYLRNENMFLGNKTIQVQLTHNSFVSAHRRLGGVESHRETGGILW